MSERSRLVASLPHGPREPMTATPSRPPGSVRRTTSVDQRRGGWGEPQEIVAAGRDLLTRADGSTEVVDVAVVQASLDGFGTVTSIEATPPMPGLAGLVGAHVSKGFRGRVDEVLQAQHGAPTVLHQLLDDFPMAALISNYGSTREMEDWNLPAQAAEKMTDLCAGWAGGATMLDALERTGIFPIPVGPPAPELASSADLYGWHDLPAMAPRSVRRRRRLDLVDGTPFVLDVHFRDSHLGADGLEDVLHEYTIAAELDADLAVLDAEATVRVLPWPECPGALGSAARVVGHPVTALRTLVAADFRGTSTCTHLNDALRSMAGAAALVEALR